MRRSQKSDKNSGKGSNPCRRRQSQCENLTSQCENRKAQCEISKSQYTTRISQCELGTSQCEAPKSHCEIPQSQCETPLGKYLKHTPKRTNLLHTYTPVKRRAGLIARQLHCLQRHQSVDPHQAATLIFHNGKRNGRKRGKRNVETKRRRYCIWTETRKTQRCLWRKVRNTGSEALRKLIAASTSGDAIQEANLLYSSMENNTRANHKRTRSKDRNLENKNSIRLVYWNSNIKNMTWFNNGKLSKKNPKCDSEKEKSSVTEPQGKRMTPRSWTAAIRVEQLKPQKTNRLEHITKHQAHRINFAMLNRLLSPVWTAEDQWK